MLAFLLACGSPASVQLEAADVRSDLADTAIDTGAGDTGDTAIDTGNGPIDTAIDTAIDTGGAGDTSTPVDTGAIDTAIDTGEPVDTAPSCAGVSSIDPSTVTLIQDSGGVYYVTIQGCADPLVVTCPEWVDVRGEPARLDGAAVLELRPIHGWATPADGTCSIGDGSLTVALR